MVNGVDIAVEVVLGGGFGVICDGVVEVLLNAAEFTTSLTNVKSTLKDLEPMVTEMEKNNTLLLQNEELKDLKEEMAAGLKRVQELSEESAWNYCKRPFYNMELDRMDKSLQRLLRILQVQGVRDVKKTLFQVNKVSSQLDGCKTDVNKVSIQLDDCKTELVEKISAWNDKTTDQLAQVASNGEESLNLIKSLLEVERSKGRSDSVQIREEVATLVEVEALGSSLLTMGQSLDKVWSKPNPHFEKMEEINRLLEECDKLIKFSDDIKSAGLIMAFDVVKESRIKVEEGTKLILKCSDVVEWNEHNTVEYAKKLDDLAKFLEAFVQRLKGTNSTMPKGSDTQNSRVYFCSLPFSGGIAHQPIITVRRV